MACSRLHDRQRWKSVGEVRIVSSEQTLMPSGERSNQDVGHWTFRHEAPAFGSDVIVPGRKSSKCVRFGPEDVMHETEFHQKRIHGSGIAAKRWREFDEYNGRNYQPFRLPAAQQCFAPRTELWISVSDVHENAGVNYPGHRAKRRRLRLLHGESSSTLRSCVDHPGKIVWRIQPCFPTANQPAKMALKALASRSKATRLSRSPHQAGELFQSRNPQRSWVDHRFPMAFCQPL